MTFASGITDQRDPKAAAETVLQQVADQLDGQSVELAFLFVSSLYKTEWGPILRDLCQRLGDPLLIGCTAGGVLGEDQELEFIPAVSLAAAHLPRVELHPFTVSPADLEEERGPGFWMEKLGVAPDRNPVGVLLPDPFTCDGARLIKVLNAVYPKMPLIGGLASGAQQAGENALFYNDETLSEGAVGVLLTGDVMLQTLVAQGCRPIGRPYIVTKSEENVILKLAGLPATEALRQLFETVSDSDKRLARKTLFLGIVMNEQKESFKRGDFLIRNLIGMDPNSGALVVGERIQMGQTVQFQIRDAHTSREDLELLLKERSAQLPSVGGLLFSCLGRGKDLYGESHVDTRIVRTALKNCPIAGFFCNGEIGPIGGHNFIHGFTASLGLFRPRSASAG